MSSIENMIDEALGLGPDGKEHSLLEALAAAADKETRCIVEVCNAAVAWRHIEGPESSRRLVNAVDRLIEVGWL